MKNISIWMMVIVASLQLVSCFTGETGPAGPAGPVGDQGSPGSTGKDGVSVKTPKLTGFFRIYLKGTEPMETKTDVDSSGYLFLSDTWTFRLFKSNGDSCSQVNRGSVEWGGSTLILTDSSNTSFTYNASTSSLGSHLEGFSSDTLINCIKCDLRLSTGCFDGGK